MGTGRLIRATGSYLLVLQSGLISSAIVMLILWLMAEYWPGVYLIGWYYSMVPIGAIAAGVVAISGYLVAAFWTGASIPSAMFLPIFVLQLSCYIGAEYVEYRRFLAAEPEATSISFFDYYDSRSRSYSLIEHPSVNEPAKGYLLRTLEMGGFAAPAFLVPLFMGKLPKCRHCKGYESTKTMRPLNFVPKAEFSQWRTLRTFQLGDEDGWDTREGYFRDEVIDLLQPLIDAIEASDPKLVQQEWANLRGQSDAESAPHCVVTPHLQYCPACEIGKLMVSFRYNDRGTRAIGLLPGIAVDAVAIDILRRSM